MGVSIHPLAVVQPGAELGADVTIGPFCQVGPNVRLGDRTVLRSHVNVEGHATLGAWCAASSKRCIRQNRQSSTPMAIRVHQELSEPSKAISDWMTPRISTPTSVPAT